MGEDMVNKQGMWFLTLTSLILVLSVYYITMPNELLISTNSNYTLDKENSDNSKITVSINESKTIETMRQLKEDERMSLTKELNDKLVNKELSLEEKNKVYEELKYISKIESKEEIIEKKIKEEYKLDSCVKIEDDVVEIVVNNKAHDANLAVNIMKSAQEEFDSPMYISVSFKE